VALGKTLVDNVQCVWILIDLQIINKLVAYNHIFIFIFLTLSKYLYNIIFCEKKKRRRKKV